MVVETEISEITHTCIGSIEYPFPFPVINSSDLVVIAIGTNLVETTLVQDLDYTVVLNEDKTGTVFTHLVYTQGQLRLTRQIPCIQPTRWTQGNRLDVHQIEQDLDRLTMLIQQNKKEPGPQGPPGLQGPPGSSSAYNIVYGNETVGAVLDMLLYVPPQITSFTLSVTTAEIGSTVSTLVANWSFNKEVLSATLTDTTINPTDTSHTFTSVNLTSNKTYTLTGDDGVNTVSSSKTVSFMNKRYWGVSANTSLSNSDILALSSEFSSSKSKTIVYDCTGGKYPYFCYPTSLGSLISMTVDGFTFSDYTITTQSFTNASGHTENYNIVRFNNMQHDSGISVVYS